MENYDVALVGAGPIGLEMAVALKRAGVNYVHFDARQIAHTISGFAPQTRFFSSNDRIAIAGVPLQTPEQSKATREEYLAYLRTVAQFFQLRVKTYEAVENIEPGAPGFLLTTRTAAGPRACGARRIIPAPGGTARPRRLGIQGEDLPHVTHDLGHPHRYFEKRVLVVGGKNSAVEAALRCHHAGARVAISYRRAAFDPKCVKYWLLPELSGLIAARRIDAYFNTLVREITTTQVNTVPATLVDAFAGGVSGASGVQLEADFVLLMVGFEADMSLHRAAGVKLEGTSEVPVFNPETMETNVPGVYVAGTAVAGTQDGYQVFIENCHVHVARIMAALQGQPPPAVPTPQEGPES